jgi:hypothetical protein
MLAGMAQQIAHERAASLNDLFGHIETERRASLEQVQQIVSGERQAAIEQATTAIDAQRKGILGDLLKVSDSASRAGSAWVGTALLVGSVLILLLLAGLLGTMLLYRRLMPVVANRSLTRA